jgi:hypothetical protein
LIERAAEERLDLGFDADGAHCPKHGDVENRESADVQDGGVGAAYQLAKQVTFGERADVQAISVEHR